MFSVWIPSRILFAAGCLAMLFPLLVAFVSLFFAPHVSLLSFGIIGYWSHICMKHLGKAKVEHDSGLNGLQP